MAATSTTKSQNSTIVVRVSADHYQGAPQFQLMVDGKPVGAVQTVKAVHGKDQWQDVTFKGNFGADGANNVEVVYLNDKYGGPGKDRNLYVDRITVDGKVYQSETHADYDLANGTSVAGRERLSRAGRLVFDIDGSDRASGGTSTPPQSKPSTGGSSSTTTGPDTIVVRVSGDRYEGAPQFQLLVDGTAVGAVQTVQAVKGKGQWQEFTFKGDFDETSRVELVYLNDRGGSAGNDRNLYVDKITVNGTVYEAEKVGLYDRVSGADMTGREKMSWSGKMVFNVDGSDNAPRNDSSPASREDPSPAPSPTPTPDPTPTPTPSPGSSTIATPMQVIQLKAGSTQADIQAALNSAKDGAVVILPKDATIKISSALEIDVSKKSVTLDLNGSTLKQAGNDSVIEAHGSHPWTKSVSIATAGGTTTLKFAGVPSDLKVGDWIKVVADDALPGGQHSDTNKVRLGQAMQVKSISGNSILVEGKLLNADLYDTNVRASKYESGDLLIRNGHIEGDQSHGDWKQGLVRVTSAIAPVVDGLSVTDANAWGIRVEDSINALIANVDGRNLKDNPSLGYLGKPVLSWASVGTTIVGLHADTVRHAADNHTGAVGANSKNIAGYGADIGMTVRDSVAYNTTSAAWSWHSEGNHSAYENVYAFDSHHFLTARGLNNSVRDSVAINMQQGIQLFEYGDNDGRHMTFDNIILREIDSLAVYQSQNPADIKIINSTLESYKSVNTTSSGVVTFSNTSMTSSVKGDNDMMTGTAGKDLLFGGAGTDTIIGNGGNDIIWGGAGVDHLTGGAGSDRFLYNSVLEGGDVITGFTGGANGDVLDVSILLTRIGYDGSDPVKDGYVRLIQSGNDTLLQVDSSGGGNGYSTLATLKNLSASSLIADNLDLAGISPGQQLIGGAGNDRLMGGRYDDYFKGSGGADRFVISGSVTGHDTIMDFTPGVDRLEIGRNIGGNGLNTADQVLSSAGTDVVGNVTLNLGNGNEIILLGVTQGELTAQSIIMI